MATFLRGAIDNHLSQIIAELLAINLPLVDANARPARLPLDDELVAALKSAASKTGIPSTRLLAACLYRACTPDGADDDDGDPCEG